MPLFKPAKNRLHSFLTGVLLVMLMLVCEVGLGQSASATWSLTVDNNVVTSGNITATALSSNGVNTPLNYLATAGVYTNGWPNNYNQNRYYQYTISPSSSYNFTSNSISFYYRRGSNGEDGVGRVYYSLNGFATAGTQLGGNFNITNNGGIQFSSSTSISVPNGSTLTVRVYAYSLGSGNFYNMSMVIAGTTTPVCSPPTISSVSPTSACEGSGSTITIDGSNFVSGGTSVTVNGVAASPVTFISSSQIQVSLPSGASGTGNIVVTTTCSSVTSGSTFTVNPLPPSFTGTVTNSSCPTSANGSIVINGLSSPLSFAPAESDYINIGSTLLSGRGAFTVEGWIYASSINRNSIFGQNNAIEFGFTADGHLELWSEGITDNVYSAGTISTGTWHHVAGTGDGSIMNIYIDGVLSNTNDHTNTSSYGTSTFNTMIGGYVWDANLQGFDGQILKVGFWNRALSQAEITSLASGLYQYSGSDSGLLAGFNFFEGTSGTTIASVGSSASTITLAGPSWSDYFTYNWTVTGNSTTIATTKDISGIAANDYTLTISNGTCTNSADFTVGSDNISAIVSQTSASGTDAQTVCANDPIVDVTYSTSGANSVSVDGLPTGILNTWVSNIITISGSTSVTTGSPFTYTITANGDCGSTTETGTITVNSLPIASISGNNSPICSGNNATFTLTGTSGATVTYNINGGTSATVVLTGGTATVTISAATSDQTLYLVSVTDGTCSQNLNGSSAVTVNTLPVPSFTAQPDPAECQGDDVIYTTEPLMTNYTWSVPGTNGSDYSITLGGIGSGSNTVTLKWLTTGSKTVTVGYTGGNGCASADPASSTITVNPTPVIGTFN